MIVEPKREILLVPLLRTGIGRAWANRDHLLRLIVVPLVVFMVIAVPQHSAFEAIRADLEAAETAPPDVAASLQAMFFALLESATIAFFAVNWIRQLTLGISGAPGVGLAITGRHFRFFFTMLGLAVGILLPGVLAAAIVLTALPDSAIGIVVVFVLGMLIWITAIARLSPAWIGLAIDAPMPLQIAWRRTAGQGFKLVLAVLAIQIVIMLVQEFLYELLLMTGFIMAAPYSYVLLTLVLGLVGFAVQISVLVTAFPHFLRETV